jgi:Domain of unknown function (DUF1918)
MRVISRGRTGTVLEAREVTGYEPLYLIRWDDNGYEGWYDPKFLQEIDDDGPHFF